MVFLRYSYLNELVSNHKKNTTTYRILLVFLFSVLSGKHVRCTALHGLDLKCNVDMFLGSSIAYVEIFVVFLSIQN